MDLINEQYIRQYSYLSGLRKIAYGKPVASLDPEVHNREEPKVRKENY
jgi:hypothetical protein